MHIQFAELPVSDQDRAKTFYVDKLGCHVAADTPMGEGGWRWIELGLPGAITNLHFIHRNGTALSDEPVLVLVDADVLGRVAKLRAKGVEITSEPHEAPWQPGRIAAEFRDSEGNRMVVASK
jgi:catechol 2,3-dioxygenase-like lactoylglutathione lyase family enzyme